MSWFTLVALILVGIFIFIGIKRGLVLELFDLLWLMGAFAAGSYAKNALAGLCIQRFHWGASYAHNFIFILFFILVMIIIFFIGVLINDSLKIYIPEMVNTVFGGITGGLKGVIFLYILVVFISLMPSNVKDTSRKDVAFSNISQTGTIMNESGRSTLHDDVILQKIQDLTPGISNIIYILAPEKAAKFYIKIIKEHKL
jgi:membrane protein required for colicin V production